MKNDANNNCKAGSAALSGAPVILMVSGGSDSTALLELASLHAHGGEPRGETGRKLLAMYSGALAASGPLDLHCLHVNHLLRGSDSDGDEVFVQRLCAAHGIGFRAVHVDIAALTALPKAQGMEATAREARKDAAGSLQRELAQRYRVADEDVRILTAHTLDDRAETFLMRSMVGTGPGGLGSIPRVNGQFVRPLLDATRQELRDFLFEQHPGSPASELWREDVSNNDGSNFRSRVRTKLVPVMRELQPGFEHALARTMDLIAEEDAAWQCQAESIALRNLTWDDKGTASLPARALTGAGRPLARRVLRQCLLAVNPLARLESRQIERVVDAVFNEAAHYATDVDSGIRVRLEDGILTIGLIGL